MNELEKTERRVDVAAQISDAVYTYENTYTAAQKVSETMIWKTINNASVIDNMAVGKTKVPKNTEIVGSMYDRDTGVAAIAVYDKLTEETYIAYAGTNFNADGQKDIITDLAIGLNDTLYLKKMSQPAVDFYDKIEGKGYYITTTTGHSYGEFQGGRVALERQVPYNYGFQGAPQSVNGKTAQEMVASGDADWFKQVVGKSKNFEEFKFNLDLYYNGAPTGNVRTKLPDDTLLKQYWDYLSRLKNPSQQTIKDAQEENKRIQELVKQYTGSSITFSSTRDILTNISSAQGEGEINFGGQAIDINWLESMVDTFTPQILKFLGITRDTIYPGEVIAIDLPIYHNMKAYKENLEAMKLSRQVAVEQIFGVDLDDDGVLEFAVTPGNTTIRDLLPKRGGQDKIALDTESMRALITNLNVCLNQAGELLALTNQTIASNDSVVNSLSNRRTNLKESIISHMESISLISAIKKIDESYSKYGDIRSNITTLSNYEPSSFSRKFDTIGISSGYAFYDSEGNDWHHGPTTSKLNKMVTDATDLILDISINASFPLLSSENNVPSSLNGGNFGNVGNLWPQADLTTPVAKGGQALINSFEGMIEKTTQGLESRSSYADGIPQAIDEILNVLSQNIQTIIECIEYTVSVASVILSAVEGTDSGLATNIESFDFSAVPQVDTSISQNYNDYLEESGIFDDRDVVSAFDNQIDVKATELATAMSGAFSNYLNIAKKTIAASNKIMTATKVNLQNLNNEFPQMIYYAPMNGPRSKKKPYGTIGQQISVSPAISVAINDINSIDIKLTEAATTINVVVSMLGGFYQPFRNGMEDAFYGAANLKSIVRSQKAIGAVLSSLITRFTNFKSQLASLGSGAAVNALSYKLDDMVTLMSNVTNVINDCFGDNESSVNQQIHARSKQREIWEQAKNQEWLP